MFEEALMEKIEVCNEILKDCRSELYLNLRFLDAALNSLAPEPSMALGKTATDGKVFRYNPEFLIEQYRIGNVPVNRCYLHSILHCLFGHVWNLPEPEDEMLWDLSCDIAAEYVLDGLALRCLRNPPRPYRRAVYDGLLKKIPVIHGEGVFRLLKQTEPDLRILARMIQEFAMDGHELWQKKDRGPKSPLEQQNRWKDIRDRMETELETFSKEAAEDSKGLAEQIHIITAWNYTGICP